MSWLVAAYILFCLAVLAALVALIFAVETDTYANWLAREQQRQSARRHAFNRAGMREQNFVAASRGK